MECPLILLRFFEYLHTLLTSIHEVLHSEVLYLQQTFTDCVSNKYPQEEGPLI